MNFTDPNKPCGQTKCGQDKCSEEPNETPVEHATEQVIGREIHPIQERAPRWPRPPQFQERPLPRKFMGAGVPHLTNAHHMMNRKRQMPQIPDQQITPSMNFMQFNVPAALPKRGCRADPFRNIDGCEKRKKLPKCLEMFGKKSRKRKWMF